MKPKKLFTFIALVMIVFFAGCKKDDYIETVGLCPLVVSTDPVNLATGVPLNKVITANFNQAMNPATITQASFTVGTGAKAMAAVTGVVTYNGMVATFTPAAALAPSTTYTGTLKNAIKDLNGNSLQEDYIWIFTTIPAAAFTLNVTAIDGTVVKNPIQATYANGDIVQLTATANAGYTFGSWSGDATGSVNPLTVLMDANKSITANYTLSTSSGPGAVNLGTAANFVAIGKTGISTTGTTLITGDIGVSPVTQTGLTGFSQIMDVSLAFSTSSYVVGKIYASDYAVPTPAFMTTAVSDMENALTTAMGMTTSVIVDLGAGNISGMTLVPGLYKYNTGLLITNVGVTLSGGPNDTWVFQVADDFTVNNTAIITLSGGAQAKNIFWVTSKQALIGSTVDFKGNILAQTLISINTGSTVLGRLLSQTAVTLNAATVIKP